MISYQREEDERSRETRSIGKRDEIPGFKACTGTPGSTPLPVKFNPIGIETIWVAVNFGGQQDGNGLILEFPYRPIIGIVLLRAQKIASEADK